MEKLEKDLLNIGLSEKEAQVYLSALSLGPSSVQNIAKKSGVNRVTTYVMIEQLTQKGLMSSFNKGKKKLYSAERPNRLLSLIHEREKELKDQETQFRSVLPALNAVMARSDNKTHVRFYEGIEGMKAAHELLLGMFDREDIKDYREIIVPMVSKGLFQEGDSPARDAARKKIMSKDIMAKKIYVTDKHVAEDIFVAATMDNTRYLPISEYPFSCEIGIYGTLVIFWLVKEDYNTVVVDDEFVSNNIRLMFDLAWSVARKPEEHPKE